MNGFYFTYEPNRSQLGVVNPKLDEEAVSDLAIQHPNVIYFEWDLADVLSPDLENTPELVEPRIIPPKVVCPRCGIPTYISPQVSDLKIVIRGENVEMEITFTEHTVSHRCQM